MRFRSHPSFRLVPKHGYQHFAMPFRWTLRRSSVSSRNSRTYEKAPHEVEATVERVHESLFGADAVARAVICEADGKPAGFAVWFYSYSTWQARKGLYLEDLLRLAGVSGSGRRQGAPEAPGADGSRGRLRPLRMERARLERARHPRL